jgi:hypothetical protein
LCSEHSPRRRSAVPHREPEPPSHPRADTPRRVGRASRGPDQDRTGHPPRQPRVVAEVRFALISSRKAMTLSGVSSRRPSRVIETSSSVGGRSPARSRALSQRPTERASMSTAYPRQLSPQSASTARPDHRSRISRGNTESTNGDGPRVTTATPTMWVARIDWSAIAGSRGGSRNPPSGPRLSSTA